MNSFWMNGFQATSIQDLLDGMGISRASLYDSFDSKEALFMAVLDMYAKHVTQLVIDLLTKSDDPVEGLMNVFDQTLIDLPPAMRSRGCLLVNTVAESALTAPHMAQRAQSHLDNVEKAFETTLQRALNNKQWTCKQPDTEQGANLLFNYLIGLRVNSKVDANTNMMRKNVRQTIRLMGLTTKKKDRHDF